MRIVGLALLVVVGACAAFDRGDEGLTAPPADVDGGTEPRDAAVQIADSAPEAATADATSAGDGAVGKCADLQRPVIELGGFWDKTSGTPPEIAPGTLSFRAPASGESSIQTGRRARGSTLHYEATFTVHAPNSAWDSAMDGTYRLFDADASIDADLAEYGAFEIGWENWSVVFRTFDEEGKPTTGKNETPRLDYDVPHTIVYDQLFDRHGFVHVILDGTVSDDLSQDDVSTFQAVRADWALHIGAIHKGNPTPAITVDFTNLCVDP